MSFSVVVVFKLPLNYDSNIYTTKVGAEKHSKIRKKCNIKHHNTPNNSWDQKQFHIIRPGFFFLFSCFVSEVMLYIQWCNKYQQLCQKFRIGI